VRERHRKKHNWLCTPGQFVRHPTEPKINIPCDLVPLYVISWIAVRLQDVTAGWRRMLTQLTVLWRHMMPVRLRDVAAGWRRMPTQQTVLWRHRGRFKKRKQWRTMECRDNPALKSQRWWPCAARSREPAPNRNIATQIEEPASSYHKGKCWT